MGVNDDYIDPADRSEGPWRNKTSGEVLRDLMRESAWQAARRVNDGAEGEWVPCIAPACPPEEEWDLTLRGDGSGEVCPPIEEGYVTPLGRCLTSLPAGVNDDGVVTSGLLWQRGTVRPIVGEREPEIIIIDDPVKFPAPDDRYLWPRASWGLADAPLWAKCIGYTLIALVAIVAGLALGILILFLVACVQALLDLVVH